jgi:glycosyltransferase involved in cell wall biosynthesis
VNSRAAADAGDVKVTVGIPTRNRSDLLRSSIASVLGQSHSRLTVIVSDNASTDDTAAAVASFRDPRVEYRPVDSAVGRAANYNRLVELAETDLVLLLADDDELHPDHLALTLGAFERWPTVGVVHTGFTIVDLQGATVAPHESPFRTAEPVVFETGAQYLERSMCRSAPYVGFSSAIFRRDAFLAAGSLRPEDGATDDFALLLRVAMSWDFAYVNRPLAMVRTHAAASSSEFGTFVPGGFRSARSNADALYDNRREFLRDADLPRAKTRRFARLAARRYRHDVLAHLSMRSNTGDTPSVLLKALGEEVRRNPRLALDPLAWRFVAGQLGGRRLRSAARRTLAGSAGADPARR